MSRTLWVKMLFRRRDLKSFEEDWNSFCPALAEIEPLACFCQTESSAQCDEGNRVGPVLFGSYASAK